MTPDLLRDSCVIRISVLVSVAATRVKEVFSRNVAAGGGGRGGSPGAVINQAKRSAEYAASLFADYFAEIDPAFDPDAFFRECCLTDAFIERMAKARVKFDRRQVDAAWRVASRLAKRG